MTLVLLVAGLLAYANGSAWRYARRLRAEGAPTPLAGSRVDQMDRGHLAMLGFCLAWSVAERFTFRELGMARMGILKSLGWGLLIGGLGSATVHGFLAIPFIRHLFTPPSEWTGISGRRLARLLLGPLFVGSALLEEVAFRGLLYAKLRRAFGDSRGLLIGGGVFAAWHLVITWLNLRRSGLPGRLVPPLYVAVLGALFIVGTGLGLLRRATGHIAGGVLAHWLLLVGVVLALARHRTDDQASAG